MNALAVRPSHLYAGDALSEARRSLAGLRRADSSGLAAAVEHAARQLTESRDVRLELTLDDQARPLAADVEYNPMSRSSAAAGTLRKRIKD